jgi:flagellum-specific peptidoglycan hydrolase FlgJ
MAGSGIWLDDATYAAQAGQLWAQQRVQDLHSQLQAGSDWANQQIQSATQAAQAHVGQLQAQLAPAIATPTPSALPPAPGGLPTPGPAPGPLATAAPGPGVIPTPAPAPAPAAVPTPTPVAAPVPAPPLPTPAATPTVAPVPDIGSQLAQGQAWASQQIANLTQPQPQPPPPPAAPPQPAAAPAQPPSAPPAQRAPAAPAAPTVIGQGKDNFIASLGPAAEQVAAESGLPAQVLLAIPANETGWGKSVASNNLYGIKGSNPQTGANTGPIATQEVYGGVRQNIQDTFRAYSDPVESMRDFVSFLRDNPRYGSALQQYARDGDADHLVQNIAAAGYATDPSWATQVNSISHDVQGTLADMRAKGQLQTPVQAAQAPGTGDAINTSQQGQNAVTARTSQFDMGLSSGDAMAFCGPAAAIAFAQTYGRNPTVAEAKALAQQVGWNPQQGMAGPQSEVALLKGLGVDAHYSQGVDWAQVGRDAQGGNPVIIDTPGHYFYVDGYNAQNGQLHVGSSGTDLKGGSEWMTPDQINRVPGAGGAARGAIFADHPLAQQDGLAQSVAQAVQNAPQAVAQLPSLIGQGITAVPGLVGQGVEALGGVIHPATQAIQDAASNVVQAVQNVGGQLLAPVGGAAQTASQLLPSLSALPSTVTSNVGDLLQQNAMTAAGIPNVAGQALSTAVSGLQQPAQSAVQEVQNAINSGLRPDLLSTPLGQAVMNVPSALSNVPAGYAPLGQLGAQALQQPTQMAIQAVQNSLSNMGLGDLTQQALAQTPAAINAFAAGGPIGWFNQQLASTGPALTQTYQDLQNQVAQSGLAQSGLGQWWQQNSLMNQMQTIQQLQDKYADSPGAQTLTTRNGQQIVLGVDPSQMTPEDREAYTNAQVAVGGMEAPEVAGAGQLARPAAAALERELPAAVEAAAQVGRPTLGEWIGGAYRGGVVSGLNTAADVAFNATLGPVLSGGAGIVRDLASFQPGRIQGRVLGAQSGIVNWADSFLQGLSQTRPESLRARAGPGLPSILANMFEGFGALHGAFQNATSQLIQSMEHGAESGEAASAQGLSGAQWFQEFQNQFQQPISARVQGMGERAAMRSDLGTLTGAFGRFVNAAGPIGDALFPVYRMGMAMANRLVEATPIGLAGTGIDIARGLGGRGPYAALQQTGLQGALDITPAGTAVGPIGERLTNNLIGTALSMWLASKATAGDITGTGPSDPDQHAVWIANGNQPDSFRGPDGVLHSWDRLPPQLRGPFMMAGAYADAVRAYNVATATQQTAGPAAYGVQDPREAAAWELVSEVGHQLASATPMRTFANIYDALQSNASVPLTAAADIASGVLGAAVPESGLVRSVAQMTDPYQRQVITPRTTQELVQSVVSNVAQNIPGLRETLPQRVDVLGRPIQNPQQGLGELSPFRAAPGVPSPILQAYERAGAAPPGAPQTVPYGPYSEIRLTPAERQEWERIRGGIIQQSASAMTADPSFQQQSGPSQRYALNMVDTIATNAANLQILSTMGPAAYARAQAKPGGLTGAVQAYSPEAFGNQWLTQATMQQTQAQHQALMNALLSAQA